MVRSERTISPWRAWVLAARPKTLLAGAVPVLAGAALALRPVGESLGTAPWAVLAACLVGALCIQVGTNFANDAFDALAGADGPGRLGPTRACAAGLIPVPTMLVATALVLAVALAIGIWLTTVAGWPILAIGVVSIALAVLYTGGPFPLAYHGLGDPFVFLFFGWAAVLGTIWAATGGGLDWWRNRAPEAFLVASAAGLQATAILAINNLRDRAGDTASGKRTLAVRLGERGSRVYHALLHVAAVGCLLGAWIATDGGATWILPVAIAGVGGGALSLLVVRRRGRALNPCLGMAALCETATVAGLIGACW